MPTILTELTRPNPTIDSESLKPGPNSMNPDWKSVPGWTIWREFNETTLGSIFAHIINAAWDNPLRVTERRGSTLDEEIFDEDQLEHQILSHGIIPVVNDALVHANKVLGKPSTSVLNLGRRGRCIYDESGDNRIYPDWALVSPSERWDSCDNNGNRYLGKYKNLLPGDTKLSSKWTAKAYKTWETGQAWEWPVRQVLTYAVKADVRYGFVITDQELVVLQFARHQTTSPVAGLDIHPVAGMDIPPVVGLSAQRERRVQLEKAHARVSSVVSDLSSSLHELTISTTSYHESGQTLDSDQTNAFNPTKQYPRPKYQTIPWSNSGKGKLTVKLALFYLCLMAGYGSSSIQTVYPRMDSWCPLHNGRFKHNTSGRVVKKLPPKANIEDADPAMATASASDDIGLTRDAVEDRSIGANISTDHAAANKESVRAGKRPANEETELDESDANQTRLPALSLLTRTTVEAMQFDEFNHMYYFEDEVGETCYITDSFVVWDEETDTYGQFLGDQWVQTSSVPEEADYDLDPASSAGPSSNKRAKESKRRRH